MKALDFMMESPDVDLYIASVSAEMKVVSANAKFKTMYRLSEGEALPLHSRLREVVSLAVKRRQNVSGVVFQESIQDKTVHFLIYGYGVDADGETAYHTILCDITALRHHYDMKLMNEKVKLIGDMAAGTANSILNPLTVVKGSLQLIEASLRTSPLFNPLSDPLVSQNVEQYIQLANNQVQEIHNYVKRWLHLGKPFQLNLRPVLVSSFLETYVPCIRKEAMARGISFACEYPGVDCQLLIDPHYLQATLNEFLKNAFEALGDGGGGIRFGVEVTEQSAVMVISDTGAGISEEHMKRVKDPFFTTKETSIGLGLNFCEVVLQKMGGAFEIRNGESGTDVRITLPKVTLE